MLKQVGVRDHLPPPDEEEPSWSRSSQQQQPGGASGIRSSLGQAEAAIVKVGLRRLLVGLAQGPGLPDTRDALSMSFDY